MYRNIPCVKNLHVWSIHRNFLVCMYVDSRRYEYELNVQRMKPILNMQNRSFSFSFFFFKYLVSKIKDVSIWIEPYPFKHFYIFARFANTYCCTHVDDSSFFFFIHVLYNRACSHMCSVARFIYQKWKTEEAFLERDINNFNFNSRLRIKFISVIYILFLDFWKVVHLVSVNFLHKKYSISHLKI